jgi:radical SAM-linked protein
VGVESLCEYLDLELVGVAEPADVADRLGRELPEGFRILEATRADPREPSVTEAQRAVHYRAEFPEGSCTPEDLARRVEAFHAAERSVVVREKPPRDPRARRDWVAAPRAKEIDLKQIVTHLAVEGPSGVAFSLRADPSGSAKPAEVLAAIFGDGTPPRGVKVLKEGVSFARSGSGRSGQPRTPRYLDA